MADLEKIKTLAQEIADHPSVQGLAAGNSAAILDELKPAPAPKEEAKA